MLIFKGGVGKTYKKYKDILIHAFVYGMKRFLCVKKGLNVRFLSYLLRALHANNILKDFK